MLIRMDAKNFENLGICLRNVVVTLIAAYGAYGEEETGKPAGKKQNKFVGILLIRSPASCMGESSNIQFCRFENRAEINSKK